MWPSNPTLGHISGQTFLEKNHSCLTLQTVLHFPGGEEPIGRKKRAEARCFWVIFLNDAFMKGLCKQTNKQRNVIGGIVRSVLSSDWILSFRKMPLRFFCIFSGLDSSFIFSTESCPVVEMDHSLFSHLPTEGRIGCLRVLAIMNKATLNIRKKKNKKTKKTKNKKHSFKKSPVWEFPSWRSG